MARTARVVYPGIPHHVTQRGSQRLPTFLRDSDYAYYRTLLATFSKRAETKVIAWCLMPNHIHLLMIPKTEDGLRATVAPLHQVYAAAINKREGWSGHLWQDRFSSIPLDESHTVAAIRYIEQNPVRAGLAKRPDQYRWSSVISHLTGKPDGVTDLEESKQYVENWVGLLENGAETAIAEELEKREYSCLPLGSSGFLDELEKISGQSVRTRGLGRPRVKRGQ